MDYTLHERDRRRQCHLMIRKSPSRLQVFMSGHSVEGREREVVGRNDYAMSSDKLGFTAILSGDKIR